jgi:NADH:ubiquinone oxidoreductase subunit B-like Fe-S oxidoreductase
MPKSVLAIAIAAYGLGVFGRSAQLIIQRWDAGLPVDMLIGGSVGEGIAWPAFVVIYMI